MAYTVTATGSIREWIVGDAAPGATTVEDRKGGGAMTPLSGVSVNTYSTAPIRDDDGWLGIGSLFFNTTTTGANSSAVVAGSRATGINHTGDFGIFVPFRITGNAGSYVGICHIPGILAVHFGAAIRLDFLQENPAGSTRKLPMQNQYVSDMAHGLFINYDSATKTVYANINGIQETEVSMQVVNAITIPSFGIGNHSFDETITGGNTVEIPGAVIWNRKLTYAEQKTESHNFGNETGYALVTGYIHSTDGHNYLVNKNPVDSIYYKVEQEINTNPDLDRLVFRRWQWTDGRAAMNMVLPGGTGVPTGIRYWAEPCLGKVYFCTREGINQINLEYSFRPNPTPPATPESVTADHEAALIQFVYELGARIIHYRKQPPFYANPYNNYRVNCLAAVQAKFATLPDLIYTITDDAEHPDIVELDNVNFGGAVNNGNTDTQHPNEAGVLKIMPTIIGDETKGMVYINNLLKASQATDTAPVLSIIGAAGGNNFTVSWGGVIGATSYTVKLDGVDVAGGTNIAPTTFNIPKTAIAKGIAGIVTVVANGGANDGATGKGRLFAGGGGGSRSIGGGGGGIG